MSLEGIDLSSPGAAILSAALLGALSGIIPTGAAEAIAVGIGFVRPQGLAIPLWIAFTVGHVLAKLPWYLIGSHADRVLGARAAKQVQRAREMLRARPTYGTGLLLVSALTSVPPFHLASIAAGITHIPALRFVLLCLLGRLVRFGVLAGAVPAFRALFG